MDMLGVINDISVLEFYAFFALLLDYFIIGGIRQKVVYLMPGSFLLIPTLYQGRRASLLSVGFLFIFFLIAYATIGEANFDFGTLVAFLLILMPIAYGIHHYIIKITAQWPISIRIPADLKPRSRTKRNTMHWFIASLCIALIPAAGTFVAIYGASGSIAKGFVLALVFAFPFVIFFTWWGPRTNFFP